MMDRDEQIQNPVADFVEPVNEHDAAEGILLLTLVETDIATVAQLGVLQPLKGDHKKAGGLS